MSEENYIDKMYKDAFKGFEVQPKKQLDLTEHTQEIGKAVQKKSAITNFIANKWLISLCVLGLGILVAVIVVSTSEEEPASKDNKILMPPRDEEKVVTVEETVSVTASEADSVNTAKEDAEEALATERKNLSTTVKISKNIKKTDSASVPKPVIIHKTVIQHDTVIEHKKVIKKVPVINEK